MKGGAGDMSPAHQVHPSLKIECKYDPHDKQLSLYLGNQTHVINVEQSEDQISSDISTVLEKHYGIINGSIINVSLTKPIDLTTGPTYQLVGPNGAHQEIPGIIVPVANLGQFQNYDGVYLSDPVIDFSVTYRVGSDMHELTK